MRLSSRRFTNAVWCISSVMAFAMFVSPLLAADWLQQGGPNRDGVVPGETAGKLATTFASQTIPLLWQTNTGMGSAPVVVSEGKIYTFGLYKAGTDPEKLSDPSSSPPFGLNNAKDATAKAIRMYELPGTPAWAAREHPDYKDHLCYEGDEYAQCLDAKTGKIIWATKLTDHGIAYQSNEMCGILASPAISDGKIVFHSPAGHLYCLNLGDGKKLWEINLWEHEMYEWAEKKVNGCGPLIIDGTVIVSYEGMSDEKYKKLIGGGPHEWFGSPLLILGGFDLHTGARKWLCKPDKGGFRLMDCRIGYAVIENNPTVLVPFGAGTYGVDPATGTKRWEYDIADDHDDAKHRRGLWAPYGSYAPVAWKNYVIDDVSNAHDDIDSRTWCIQITDNKPKLVWETNELVPYTECCKSNLIIRDGKVYGFDAHGVWDDPGVPSEQRWLNDPKKPHDQPGRNKRDKSIGQFQCRDVATGKLLWSADPMTYLDGHGQPGGEWYPTLSIVSGDLMIAYSHAGLGIMRLKEDGVTVLAKGPFDHYFIWNNRGFGGEPVLVDGLLYVRKFASSADGSTNLANLFCYDVREHKSE